MPYTKGIPKCMVRVNDHPLVQYQINVLRSLGVNDIIIVRGHQGEKINFPNVRYYENNEYKITNMVYSLFKTIKEFNSDIIISYGDIAYSRSVLNELLKTDNEFSVVIDLEWKNYWKKRFNNPLEDAETLVLKDNKILEIGKPASTYKNIMGQYIGLTKFSKKGLIKIKKYFNNNDFKTIQKKPFKKAYMTDLLQTIIDKGNNVFPVKISGEWVEVDTVIDLKLDITKKRLLAINS